MKIFRTGAASCTFLFLALIIVLPGCQMKNQPIVYIPSEHVSLIDLAAKEIRRYVYLRTGTILEIRDIDKIDTTRRSIVLGVDTTLPSESFQLFNDIAEANNYASLHITGHNPVSVLYGAYAFIEKLGVRFYLHGDVIPDKKIRFEIPDLNETHTPRFAIRGIQPFHDFPEGPDWWTLENYKAYLNQMVKMRMNFIGFHTYPQGGVGPEPLVWIGPKNAVNDNGTVKTAYRARHFLTSSGTWGYSPKNTSDYSHGLGVLFPDDNYGTDYMKGITVWPENPDQEVMLFNRSAAFFREVFEYAHQLGIKTCVGTETPLVVPSQVKERYPGLTAEDYYEGIFTWIKKNYPVDYYWFWTPEGWTWGGNSKKDIQATIDDLTAAQKAVEATGASFQLATCGWVLGPAQDRAMFDRILPKTWPMSCINRQVGFSPVDSAFARIKGRPLWAIPWMEDDPALTIPQLWAGRMIEDASDALNSGCTGLLGIHWRTRPLSMNVGALAQAGWGESDGESTDVDGYYHNWALGNFGVEVADSMAGLFAGMDGQEIRINRGGGRKTRLPRPADWAHGPGGVVPDTTDWEIRKRDYAFVDRMESWRDLIHKPGYRERFDYWLNQFKYLRAYGKFACTVGQINQYLARCRRGDQSVRTNAADELVKLRIQLMNDQTEAMKYLVSFVSTPGGLGTIANWQQHIRTYYIDQPATQIQTLIHDTLPSACWPSMDTLPVHRIIVPAVRTSLNPGEDFHVTVLLYGIHPDVTVMKYRPLGVGGYQSVPVTHQSRGVYRVLLPAQDIPDEMEYYLEIHDRNGATYRWPATAGRINQTVVKVD